KVGWEQAFGFTNNLDPVGEYLGDAFAIHTSLLTRTLVGYNHVAGAAGNVLVPDIATSLPKPTNGGKTHTFHIKPGGKVGQPRRHLGGLRERVQAAPEQEGRPAVRLLLQRDQGVLDGQRREHLRDQDAEPAHDRLQPDGPDRRLPLPDVDARHGPAAERGDEV